jgi:hypothetical protein
MPDAINWQATHALVYTCRVLPTLNIVNRIG